MTLTSSGHAVRDSKSSVAMLPLTAWRSMPNLDSAAKIRNPRRNIRATLHTRCPLCLPGSEGFRVGSPAMHEENIATHERDEQRSGR